MRESRQSGDEDETAAPFAAYFDTMRATVPRE